MSTKKLNVTCKLQTLVGMSFRYCKEGEYSDGQQCVTLCIALPAKEKEISCPAATQTELDVKNGSESMS